MVEVDRFSFFAPILKESFRLLLHKGHFEKAGEVFSSRLKNDKSIAT
jgi:hypothetical protein